MTDHQKEAVEHTDWTGQNTCVAAELARVYGDLRTRALFLTQNPDRADDLLQQVCERALRMGMKLRPGSNFVAWLTRVMRNLFIDEYRSRRTHLPLDGLFELEGVDESTEAVGPFDLLTMADIEEAMRSMNAADRTILELTWFQNRSYRQLSTELGLHPKTVGTRLHRARGKLRKLLLTLLDRTSEPGCLALPPCVRG